MQIQSSCSELSIMIIKSFVEKLEVSINGKVYLQSTKASQILYQIQPDTSYESNKV